MQDILVIGGGIAGLSAAARLSETAKVTVIEAETALGYHASGRSAALIEPNYGATSVQALNRASVAFLAEGGYLSPRGLMIIAQAHERAAYEADIAVMGTSPITKAEALDFVPVLNPEKLAFAAYHEDAQDIDTDLLLQDFARTLRGHGGTVETGCRVEAIRRDAGLWEVRASDRVFTAPTLINAAGAWADGIAQMAGIAPLGITPHRRSMARIPAPGGHDVRAWPMFFGVNETWYAKPDAGCLLVSPADEDPVEPHDAWAEDMTLAQGLALYEEMVSEPVTRLLSSWAGLRSFAPDRTLVLGRDPDAPEFIWCAGQGGYGFQTAPAASRLLADLVLGRAPEMARDTVAALQPDRLR
ncbi:FAD-dependent catabolic D-arginine dehydrogenase DauA [Roseobacter fucihabitans]|uniref:FAD-dependent catabolic D-arginine dehydrogenase DauA n=1 Tax=Roseobacter fucihabitans TaxID=1537242 RepID=A0ABZ2BXX5_9RHOB|nr:FAD-binding oxidoreductase [Roseobacter litoralis]MBC6967175.1 Hydrogen cyanide synthase subunit HcnC precursor [Roseobacter litoralis]